MLVLRQGKALSQLVLLPAVHNAFAVSCCDNNYILPSTPSTRELCLHDVVPATVECILFCSLAIVMVDSVPSMPCCDCSSL